MKLNLKAILFLYLALFLDGIKLGRELGWRKGLYAIRNDTSATAQGGAQIIIVLISVFIGSMFGLYLTPSFATACIEASWAYNSSDFEAVLDVIYTMALPVLWAVIMLLILAGAGVGVYRLASNLT